MNFSKGNVHINVGNLYYEIRGKGEPVLLLAGGPGISADYMTPIAEFLAEFCMPILLHQRGTGKSKLDEINESTLSLDLCVADILRLKNHLKVDSWTILGHSWGGLLAAHYALSNHDTIEKLILISSCGTSYKAFTTIVDTVLQRLTGNEKELAQSLLQQVHVAPENPENRINFFKLSMYAYFVDHSLVEATQQTINSDSLNLSVYNVLVTELITKEINPDFSKMNIVPTFNIHPRQDIFSVEPNLEILSAFRNTKMHYVDRSGHYPWLDNPNDFYAILKNIALTANSSNYS